MESIMVSGVYTRLRHSPPRKVYCARFSLTESGEVVKNKTLKAQTKQDALIEAEECLAKMLVLGQNVKRCGSCRKYKPTTMFYKNATCKDGLNNECKACFDMRAKGTSPSKHRKNSDISKCLLCGELFKQTRIGFSVCVKCKKRITTANLECNRWFLIHGIEEPTPAMHSEKVLQLVLKSAIKRTKKKGA